LTWKQVADRKRRAVQFPETVLCDPERAAEVAEEASKLTPHGAACLCRKTLKGGLSAWPT